MNSSNNKQALIELLKQYGNRFANAVYFCQHSHGATIEKVHGLVIVRGRTDNPWVYLCEIEDDACRKIESAISRVDCCFCVFTRQAKEALDSIFEVEWELECKRYVLPPEVNLPPMPHGMIRLDDSHVSKIYDKLEQKKYLSCSYVQERIEAGPGFCVEKHGRPAGWVLTHDDGAVGMLEVEEEWRGKGLGRELLIAISHELRRKGMSVYCNIEPGNKMEKLVKELGFVESGSIFWIKGLTQAEELSQ